MLPYHATPQFSRLAQICKLDGTLWVFLSKMQSSGATLPRHALSQMCHEQPVRSPLTYVAVAAQIALMSNIALLCSSWQVCTRYCLLHMRVGFRPDTQRNHEQRRRRTQRFVVLVQALMKLVCQNVREAHAARALAQVTASFYATLICEVVLSPKAISSTEKGDRMQLLLPYLTAGLRPVSQAPMRAATYAIIACLLSCTTLSEDVAQALVNDVCKHAPDAQLHEALMLAAHALASQPVLRGELSAAAATALAARGTVPGELAMLQQDGLAVDDLVQACALAWCGSLGEAASCEAVQALVSEADVSQCAQALAHAALSTLVAARTSDAPEALGPVLRVLDAKHADALDLAVRQVLQSRQDGAEREGQVQQCTLRWQALCMCLFLVATQPQSRRR